MRRIIARLIRKGTYRSLVTDDFLAGITGLRVTDIDLFLQAVQTN